MLIPLWTEFVNRSSNKTYKILDDKDFQCSDDNASKFYFQMLYRTYEALGTYCFLDAIYRKNSVTWKIYTN